MAVFEKDLKKQTREIVNALRCLNAGAQDADNSTVVTFCQQDDTLGDGTSIVTFVRASLQAIEGGALNVTPLGNFTDTTLSTSYTPVGTISNCLSPTEIGYEVEQSNLCDDTLNDGTNLVCFVRHTVYNKLDGTIVLTYETDINNNEYTVLGTVTKCVDEDAVLKYICKCDDVNGDGSNIVQYVDAIAHVYKNGTLSATLLGQFTDDTLLTEYTPVNGGICDNIGVEVIDQIKRCMVDDVNGDGTLLVPYTEYIALNSDGSTTSIITFNGTLTGPYTPTNGVDPNTLGVPANGKAGMVRISNGVSWSPDSTIKDFAYSINGVSNGSSFLDSNGNLTTNLPDGHNASWNFNGLLSDGVPVITAGNPSEIIINYTTL